MNNINWFGHAGFSFTDIKTGNRVYYIDPFQLPKRDLEKADIVFITHAHHDHLSPKDISSIIKFDTVVVATSDSFATLEIEQEKLSVVPNKEYEVKGFKFKTVPAYNVQPERLKFHPKENGWVGYIFEINGLKIYHAGDTDFIPEMKSFKDLNLDIALLPMGGTYTMNVEEAIKAANAIGAKKTIPMHYKMLLGDKSVQVEKDFMNGVKNSKVIFLNELG